MDLFVLPRRGNKLHSLTFFVECREGVEKKNKKRKEKGGGDVEVVRLSQRRGKQKKKKNWQCKHFNLNIVTKKKRGKKNTTRREKKNVTARKKEKGKPNSDASNPANRCANRTNNVSTFRSLPLLRAFFFFSFSFTRIVVHTSTVLFYLLFLVFCSTRRTCVACCLVYIGRRFAKKKKRESSKHLRLFLPFLLSLAGGRPGGGKIDNLFVDGSVSALANAKCFH